jgi:hypothetical protein
MKDTKSTQSDLEILTQLNADYLGCVDELPNHHPGCY